MGIEFLVCVKCYIRSWRSKISIRKSQFREHDALVEKLAVLSFIYIGTIYFPLVSAAQPISQELGRLKLLQGAFDILHLPIIYCRLNR